MSLQTIRTHSPNLQPSWAHLLWATSVQHPSDQPPPPNRVTPVAQDCIFPAHCTHLLSLQNPVTITHSSTNYVKKQTVNNCQTKYWTFLTVVFIKNGFYSSNNVVWCMAKLFFVSDEFRLLYTKVGITAHRIDVTPSMCCIVLCIRTCDDLITVMHDVCILSVVYIVSVCLSLYRSGE